MGRPQLTVVGGGKMGAALLGGLVAAGHDPASLCVVEALAPRRDELSRELPGVVVADAVPASEGVVLAVKPADVSAAATAVAGAGADRVLSVAAGVPLSELEAALGEVPVVRAMPNTPALIGAGMAAIAGGRRAGEADLAWAESVLAAVGDVVRVPEAQLDAVTGLSGSGPAYVFLLAEALVDAGVLVGLPRPLSTRLAVQTMLGSSRLLAESGEGPEALRAAVTSPAGTTAAGLRALEAAGFRAAVHDAVVAATERSRELGGP